MSVYSTHEISVLEQLDNISRLTLDDCMRAHMVVYPVRFRWHHASGEVMADGRLTEIGRCTFAPVLCIYVRIIGIHAIYSLPCSS